MPDPQADPRRPMQIVAGGLIAGPVFFLGTGLLLRGTGTQMGDVPILTYVAFGAALLSPLVAAFVRHQILAPFVHEVPPEKKRAALILSFAVLEAATFLCGVAFLLSSTYWPLVAAAVPLATMVVWFPRG
jgi:hypothetical protein